MRADLGRGERDHRRRQRLHGQDATARTASIGFSPIPAMSMVSLRRRRRYLSLLGGVCMSFYDWYCDLPPASPMTWGEQTDVPESADWYNAGFLMLWGSNVPQTRTPDAHFYTEVALQGRQERGRLARTMPRPRSSPICGCIRSRAPTPRWRWRWATSSCASSTSTAASRISHDYARRYTDLPMLVRLVQPGRALRAGAAAARRGFRRRVWARRTTRHGRRWRSMQTSTPSWCRTVRSASAGASRASGTWRRRTATATRRHAGADAGRRQ